MKKRTNTATIRLKLESFDPRMDQFRSTLNAELADIQTRLEKIEAVQKGRARKAKPAPLAPPIPDGE
jgi:hypothetical protein